MTRHNDHGAAPTLGYRHEALLYSGDAEFLDAVVPFLEGGLSADEPVLVAVLQEKIALLRRELGRGAARVQFMDMAELGRNPARLIPVWRSFLDSMPTARRIRGLGEPIWSGRSGPELVECQRHEALLNLAVSGREPLWLLCPYDVGRLNKAVIDEAFRSHPYIRGAERHVHDTRDHGTHARVFLDAPLTPPPLGSETVHFTARGLHDIRSRTRSFGESVGVCRDRLDDFELAVGELAANSVLHGGGQGTLTLWVEGSQVVGQVEDTGHIIDPLAGRRAPEALAAGGRGLWLVNQLCDLVQIRVFDEGTTVRLYVERHHI